MMLIQSKLARLEGMLACGYHYASWLAKHLYTCHTVWLNTAAKPSYSIRDRPPAGHEHNLCYRAMTSATGASVCEQLSVGSGNQRRVQRSHHIPKSPLYVLRPPFWSRCKTETRRYVVSSPSATASVLSVEALLAMTTDQCGRGSRADDLDADVPVRRRTVSLQRRFLNHRVLTFLR